MVAGYLALMLTLWLSCSDREGKGISISLAVGHPFANDGKPLHLLRNGGIAFSEEQKSMVIYRISELGAGSSRELGIAEARQFHPGIKILSKSPLGTPS